MDSREILEELGQALAQEWYPARLRLLARLAQLTRSGLPAWVPEADVEETPREVLVSLALPGVEKADIRIEALKDELVVSGRRREADGGPPARREQPRGAFLRRLRLPCPVKPRGAKASYRDGVLRVRLPRADGGLARSVKVG